MGIYGLSLRTPVNNAGYWSSKAHSPDSPGFPYSYLSTSGAISAASADDSFSPPFLSTLQAAGVLDRGTQGRLLETTIVG